MSVRTTTFAVVIGATMALLLGVGMVAASVGMPSATPRAASIKTDRPMETALDAGSTAATSSAVSDTPSQTATDTAKPADKPASKPKPGAGTTGSGSAGSNGAASGSDAPKASGGSSGDSPSKPSKKPSEPSKDGSKDERDDDDDDDREVIAPPVREDDLDDDDHDSESKERTLAPRSAEAPRSRHLLGSDGSKADSPSETDQSESVTRDDAAQVGNVSSD